MNILESIQFVLENNVVDLKYKSAETHPRIDSLPGETKNDFIKRNTLHHGLRSGAKAGSVALLTGAAVSPIHTSIGGNIDSDYVRNVLTAGGGSASIVGAAAAALAHKISKSLISKHKVNFQIQSK